MGRLHRKAMEPDAILLRLVVILALVLFAAPLGHADRSVAQANTAAEIQVDQSDGILTTQRHLLRAQLPDDDTFDLATPIHPVPAPPAPEAVRIAVAQNATLVLATLRVRPPVRGPPAV